MANNTKFKNSEHFNKHLTLEERININSLITTNRNTNGTLKITLKKMAEILQRDPSTISKEVKKNVGSFTYGNIFFKYTKKYCNLCSKKSICKKYENIDHKRGTCSDFEQSLCKLTLQFPYCCNGCPKRHVCVFPKRYYDCKQAQKDYENILVSSRKSIMLNTKELEDLDEIVSNGLKKGQSIHHIFCSNDLMVCEKTIYNYLHDNLLTAKLIDAPRILRLRPKTRKKPTHSKIMVIQKAGRQYEDFKEYISSHPGEMLSQWDTVEGVKGGKVLLSLLLVPLQFHFYFILPDKTAESVVNKLNEIQDKIGLNNFKRVFGFALTDNGSEFTDITGMIADKNGEVRTNLFFCHPYASYEKGSCERDHQLLRYICPKGTSLDSLDDDKVALIMSHINSYIRKSIENSTPIEKFYALFGSDILNKLGIKPIEPNDVNLKPTLIK